MEITHFTEADFNTVGIHTNLSNIVPEEFKKNFQIVGEKLEEARKILSDYFGHDTPIIVAYWYRGPALNAAVGGSITSAHMEGLAVDTHYIGHDVDEIASILMQHSTFMAGIDQLIIEHGCLHYGLPCKASDYLPRHQLRHDHLDHGVRTYPLVSVWRSTN